MIDKKAERQERLERIAKMQAETDTINRVEEEPKLPDTVLPDSMMYCPDCGQAISKRAVTCPNCGCPINSRNTVTIRLPRDENVMFKMKYEVTDDNGTVLANGVSGETLTFTLDKPTTLTCFLVGKMYSNYKIRSIEYYPHGDARYEVVRSDKGLQSWVEIMEESQAQRQEQREQDKKKGVSGAGIFFAVLIAIIAAVWLIPRLFMIEWTIRAMP